MARGRGLPVQTRRLFGGARGRSPTPETLARTVTSKPAQIATSIREFGFTVLADNKLAPRSVGTLPTSPSRSGKRLKRATALPWAVPTRRGHLCRPYGGRVG